jgi:phage terminase large subunit-like protein
VSAGGAVLAQADRTTAYARDIVERRIIAGELMIAAAMRHLVDMESGHERGLIWRPEEAERIISSFPVYFTITDGPRAGEPFELLPWMIFATGSLFGWYKRSVEGQERWRFDEAYVETAKGQGKSPWMATVALIAMAAMGRKRAQVVVTGPNDNQAMVTMADAAAAVRATLPGEEDGTSLESQGKFVVRGLGANAHTIEHVATGSTFRTYPGTAKQISGPRPDFVFVDEVHELASTALIDMWQASLAKNARGGMLIACTNTPAQTQAVGTFYSERAQRVVLGQDVNDSLFVLITRVDVKDRETVFENECVWKKSMPALGVTFPAENVRREVVKARNNPSEAARVKRLYMGIPTGAVDFWLDDPTMWDACLGDVIPAQNVNLPCWLALDLSDKHDLTALSACWKHADGRLEVFSWYWTCEANLETRAKQDGMPYPLWRDEGRLTVVPGASISKDFVADKVAQLVAEQNVQFLAFDPAGMASFEEACQRVGLPVWRSRGGNEKPGQGLKLVPHSQGLRVAFKDGQLSMPRSIELMEDRVREATVKIDRSPVTYACAANARPVMDGTGNRAFDKQNSRGRIDGLVTTVMAVGAADMAEPVKKTSAVARRGILIL